MEVLGLVAVASLLLVCAAGVVEAAKPVPLIPREVLFGNPDRAQARLSPDGMHLSYLAPVNGVLNIWVGPVGEPEAAQPVTKDTHRGIQQYFWAFTNRHVIYLQDRDGNENWRAYSVDIATHEVKDLTPLEGVQARIEAVSHLFPNEIIVGLNNRNPQLHDLYRVNLATGERTLLRENPGFAQFMIDDQYVPRLAASFSPGGGLAVLRLGADGSPEPFLTIDPEDALTTHPLDFDKAGRTVYLIDSRGRDTAALVTMDLDTKQPKLVAEDARSDIDGVMIHPTEKTLQAYSTNYLRSEWHPLDAAVGKDLAYLKTVADGELSVASRTLDDAVWLVAYEVDNGPARYYRYDRHARKATFLFTVRKALEKQPLVHMYPVVIKSRDGLDLVSYLTLPAGTERKGEARPTAPPPRPARAPAVRRQPLPLVLSIHGGPWYRDSWGFDPVHQWLANRGYAVLSVNFRGSTGFGKRFINAANHEWGGKMLDDLIDAAHWAIKEGIADPKRVAIFGGSYGGYATLAGVTMAPEAFACGVDLVGPSNLITFLKNVPEYWIPMLPLFKGRIGDDGTEEGRAFLRERSPLTHTDRIRCPLLIGQGANDPRVPQRESDQIVKAMQEHHIPATYLLYSDEGHGFARPENSLSFWAVMEAFLAPHLDGRAEPIGNDFRGSTIRCLAGADQVPGLAEALTTKR